MPTAVTPLTSTVATIPFTYAQVRADGSSDRSLDACRRLSFSMTTLAAASSVWNSGCAVIDAWWEPAASTDGVAVTITEGSRLVTFTPLSSGALSGTVHIWTNGRSNGTSASGAATQTVTAPLGGQQAFARTRAKLKRRAFYFALDSDTSYTFSPGVRGIRAVSWRPDTTGDICAPTVNTTTGVVTMTAGTANGSLIVESVG